MYNNVIRKEENKMNDKLIEKYTKQFGTRFSRNQKTKFIHEIANEFSELGYEKKEIEGRKWLNKAKDYFFGNIKNAKTVIVVPYDTPERKIWNKVYYFPFDGEKTASKTMAATFVPIVALYALILVFVFFSGKMTTNPILTAMISLIMFILLIFLVYFMTHGIRNTKNFTRNSASIITALEIANALSKDERKKVGFLFTDKNKSRFLGADIAGKEFKDAGKNPNIICLDCIGKGSTLQIGYRPQNRKMAQEVVKCDPNKKNIEVVKIDEGMQFQSAMAHFDKAIVISCGEVDSDGRLYILGTGTSKDQELQVENLERVTGMVTSYLHKQK